MGRTAGYDCSGGLASMLYSEVLSKTAQRQGCGAVVPIGPMRLPCCGGGAVYPFSESALLRRLMADQVR